MAALEEADVLCLRLFHEEEDGAISRLIEANQDRGAQILEEWHALCSASFGEHRALCEELFQDVYVPGLRDAYMCLWRRDLVEFVRLGRRLGEKLARAGVPFVSYVAYLNLLKKSYAKVLADKPEQLPDLLNHVDPIHSALVSICADSYYRAIADADRGVAADYERPKDETDIADAPMAGMAAASEAMRVVFRKIRRVATNLAPVLIIGETGTGKELVARAIHEAGPRRHGPFVAIN